MRLIANRRMHFECTIESNMWRSDGDRTNNDNGRTNAVIADYVIVIRAFFQTMRLAHADYMKKRYDYYYIKSI